MRAFFWLCHRFGFLLFLLLDWLRLFLNFSFFWSCWFWIIQIGISIFLGFFLFLFFCLKPLLRLRSCCVVFFQYFFVLFFGYIRSLLCIWQKLTSTFFEKSFLFIIFLLLITNLFHLFIDHIIERFFICFDRYIIKTLSIILILVIWFNRNFIEIYKLLLLRFLFCFFNIVFWRFLIFNWLFLLWRIFVIWILLRWFNWYIIKSMFNSSRFNWNFIKIMLSRRFDWHVIKIMFVFLKRLINSLKFINFNLFLLLIVYIFGWPDRYIIKFWEFRVFYYFFRLFFRDQRFLVIFLIQIYFLLFIFKLIFGLICQLRLIVVCLRFWIFWI